MKILSLFPTLIFYDSKITKRLNPNKAYFHHHRFPHVNRELFIFQVENNSVKN